MYQSQEGVGIIKIDTENPDDLSVKEQEFLIREYLKGKCINDLLDVEEIECFLIDFYMDKLFTLKEKIIEESL